MFIFGHLGFGLTLAKPWAKRLSWRLVLVGTLLPDILDKPLYYALVWTTGKRGLELGLISSGRTFGHTALFLATLCAATLLRRSRLLAALALGTATHLLLDAIADYFTILPGEPYISALLWPFTGLAFPVQPTSTLGAHLLHFATPFFCGAEGLGLLLIARGRSTLRNSKDNHRT
ncbi:metal-dependent hydrolase [Bdellovibrionota bacterium FG-2]